MLSRTLSPLKFTVIYLCAFCDNTYIKHFFLLKMYKAFKFYISVSNKEQDLPQALKNVCVLFVIKYDSKHIFEN